MVSRSSLALMEEVLRQGEAGDCLASAPYNRRDAVPSMSRSPARASSARAWRSRSPGLGLSVALRGAPCIGAAPATTCAPMRSTPARSRCCAASRSGTRCPATRRTPVHDMLVHGDAAGAALEFSAWEQRVGELAVITDAAALERELDAALRFAPHVTRVEADVPAALVAHCEGRAAARAGRRSGAGIERRVLRPEGDRRAARRVAAASATSRGSGSARPTCSRCCRSTGPSRALVRAGLVAAGRARRGAARGRAGGFRARARCSPPAARPASCVSPPSAPPGRSPSAAPRAWCGPGWVLVGDAAHVVHPLAGQGLNLGLADVAALVSVIEAREPWRRLGDERLLRRYVRLRAAPTWAMLRITDGLLRLFAEDNGADPRTPQQWPDPRQSDLAAQALAHRAGARLLKASS